MPTLNDLIAALVAELEEGEVPPPLVQEFTLANIRADLARLAGEELPATPRQIVGGSVAVWIKPITPDGYADAYFVELAELAD